MPTAEQRCTFPGGHGEAGSSLVEVMIGLIVLTVALLGIVNVMTHVAQQRQSSQELSYAFAACRDNLEQLRALPVATLNGSAFAIPGPTGAANFLQPVPGDADGLPGQIEVQVEKQTPIATLYRVAVVAEWDGRRGQRRLRLETVLGERR